MFLPCCDVNTQLSSLRNCPFRIWVQLTLTVVLSSSLLRWADDTSLINQSPSLWLIFEQKWEVFSFNVHHWYWANITPKLLINQFLQLHGRSLLGERRQQIEECVEAIVKVEKMENGEKRKRSDLIVLLWCHLVKPEVTSTPVFPLVCKPVNAFVYCFN